MRAMSKTMDRRKFLLGSVGAAALGAFVKPAPTPFVEGSLASTELMTLEQYIEIVIRPKIDKMSQQIAHTIMYGNPEYSPTQFTGLIPRVECG